MPGASRTAVLGAAFLLLTATWATAESPRQHVLPAGTAVVFVTDAALDARPRDGDVVRAHLRDNLVLDGTIVAAAGTHAELVAATAIGPDKTRHTSVSIDRFSITAGLMPVKPVEPIVPPVPAGTPIEATTLAEVDHIGDRWSIRLLFPFRLSNDPPASAYTPTPARTAPPSIQVPRGRPTPAPPTAAPATAAPDPAATKIPSR
ncbi:MAG TPA: hypothetical protein VGD01_14485 [Candidatus Elarobacter sp.]|jgi:hypothetical protein